LSQSGLAISKERFSTSTAKLLHFLMPSIMNVTLKWSRCWSLKRKSSSKISMLRRRRKQFFWSN